MKDNNRFLTTAPKEKEFTIDTGLSAKNVLKNSVHKHKEMEETNIAITGDEIKQQNENL
ncbi:hypothetical protein [Lysinibacillus yapensis]|uniref:hypothetical protein n=1 Tax=Ureibacillus yapensis TaxID=2304605 RepID=UPI0018F65658|nr:hypothetical protein [Lysinibacillus yapensis]